MPRIEKTVELAAAPEQVWAVVCDPARLGDWLTLHRSWVGETPTEFVAGAQVTAVASLVNLPATITWTVAEFDPPTRVRLSGIALAGVQVAISLDVAPEGGGSTMSIAAEFDGELVAGPFGPVVEQAGARELDVSTVRLTELLAG